MRRSGFVSTSPPMFAGRTSASLGLRSTARAGHKQPRLGGARRRGRGRRSSRSARSSRGRSSTFAARGSRRGRTSRSRTSRRSGSAAAFRSRCATATMTTVMMEQAMATTTVATTAFRSRGRSGGRSTTAVARATATATMTTMAGDSRLLTAHQGDANDREEDRDPQKQSAIHPRILPSKKNNTRPKTTCCRRYSPPPIRDGNECGGTRTVHSLPGDFAGLSRFS